MGGANAPATRGTVLDEVLVRGMCKNARRTRGHRASLASRRRVILIFAGVEGVRRGRRRKYSGEPRISAVGGKVIGEGVLSSNAGAGFQSEYSASAKVRPSGVVDDASGGASNSREFFGDPEKRSHRGRRISYGKHVASPTGRASGELVGEPESEVAGLIDRWLDESKH